MTEKANAEIYRLSEFGELSQRIAAIRDHGVAMQKYKEDLRTYNKQRRGRDEVNLRPLITRGPIMDGPMMGFLAQVERMDNYVPILRPLEPTLVTWGYSAAETSSFMGIRSHYDGHDFGLLADGGKYNRPVNGQRVSEYQKLMQAGKWNDLLSDPIAITSDGEVINGQHRLAAGAGLSNFGADDPDPKFLVLFNVSRDEVAFTDASKRTGRDTTVVAQKSVAERS